MESGADGFRILAQADGNIRYVSSRPVPGISVVRQHLGDGTTALAGWLRRSAAIGLGSAALLLCSLYLLIAITRQVRYLSNSETSLMQKSQQLDAALNNMSQGLSMFDGQQRLVVCNKQYAEMYNLPPELTKPGTTARRHPQGPRADGTSPASSDYTVADRIEECPARAVFPHRQRSVATDASHRHHHTSAWPTAAGSRSIRTSPRKSASKPNSPIWRATTP